MLQRARQIRTQIHQMVDACLFAASFWIAYDLRGNTAVIAKLNLPLINDEILDSEKLVWLFVALIPAAPLILESQGFYKRSPLGSQQSLLWSLFKGCLITTLSLVLLMYALHFVTPRIMMVFFGVISFGLVYGKEVLVRWALRTRMVRSQLKRSFILVGTTPEIPQMRQNLLHHLSEGVDIVAELNLTEGSPNRIVDLLHHHSTFGVVLSAKHASFEQVEYIIRSCELEGVEVWLIADFFNAQISRTSFDELLGRPVLVFRTTPEVSWQSLAKQGMDFFGALVLLVLLAPLFLILAAAIKLSTPGPVWFRQQRSGLSGSPFQLYKFRTMITNADQLKHELEAMNEMTGPVFKVTNDPRVTPLGKFLRKYSLDELPQLLNVLRGEMSLVGPRPLPVDEVQRFEDLAHRRRLSVKPGLTGLWQVSGRSQISDFKEWVRLDLEYIDTWSLWLDLKILILTLPAVLRGTGAK